MKLTGSLYGNSEEILFLGEEHTLTAQDYRDAGLNTLDRLRWPAPGIEGDLGLTEQFLGILSALGFPE